MFNEPGTLYCYPQKVTPKSCLTNLANFTVLNLYTILKVALWIILFKLRYRSELWIIHATLCNLNDHSYTFIRSTTKLKLFFFVIYVFFVAELKTLSTCLFYYSFVFSLFNWLLSFKVLYSNVFFFVYYDFDDSFLLDIWMEYYLSSGSIQLWRKYSTSNDVKLRVESRLMNFTHFQ